MNKLLLFVGPCVLENRDFVLRLAEDIKKISDEFSSDIELSFKGSFDKANRTSINSFRGPGMDEGLKWLQEVNKQFELPTITDFHLPDQAESIAEVVDTLQIPAFLCRQTDLILAGAEACKKYGRTLKIKKGQFLSPQEMEHPVEKAASLLPKDKILVTERGSSFGYNQLVVDMSSFQVMKSFGVKAIHDATHCVQRPGGMGNQTGGNRGAIEVLAKAALAAGANGIFIETHPDPPKALSDSATAYPLDQLRTLLNSLLPIYKVVQ